MRYPTYLAIFIILVSLAAVKSVTFELQYDLWYINGAIEIAGSNLSYIFDSDVYIDLQNKTAVILQGSSVCSSNCNAVSTTNNSVFCLQIGNITYLNHIEPSNLNIISQYHYSGSNFDPLTVVGDYIILSSTTNTTFSADIFNAKTSSFYCHIPPIALNHQKVRAISTNGDAIILLLINGTSYTISYISCNEAEIITTPLPSDGNLIAMNNSLAFVLTGYSLKYFTNIYIPITFDLTGQAILGKGVLGQLTNLPYDSSHLMVQINNSNLINYYIDSNLNLESSEIFDINLGQAGPFGSVPGDETVFLIDNNVNMFYNLSSGQVISSFSASPPIVLANGSVYNFSGTGDFFMQNPGGPVVAVKSPYYFLYQSYDYNQIWSFYNPHYQEIYEIEDCMLLRIQINTSTFTEYKLNKCSCDVSSGPAPLFSVFNVTVDENDEPTVVYICSNGLYEAFIANTTQEMKVTLEPGTPLLSYNSYENTLTSLTSSGGPKVDVKKYDLATGKTINNSSLKGTLESFASLLPDGSFLFGAPNSNTTEFSLFDVNKFDVVLSFNSTVNPQTMYLDYPNFIALGFNSDDSGPDNFAGFVLTGSDNGYFVDLTGKKTEIPIDSDILDYNLAPNSNNSFFVIGLDKYDVIRVMLYEITEF